MLVVSNAYLNPHIRPLIPEAEFIHSLERTILLLERLSPMSPVFRKNMEVLRHAQAGRARRVQTGARGRPAAHGLRPAAPAPPPRVRAAEPTPEYGQSQSPGRSHRTRRTSRTTRDRTRLRRHAGPAVAVATRRSSRRTTRRRRSSAPPPGEPQQSQQQEQQPPQQQWATALVLGPATARPVGPRPPGTPQFPSGGGSCAARDCRAHCRRGQRRRRPCRAGRSYQRRSCDCAVVVWRAAAVTVVCIRRRCAPTTTLTPTTTFSPHRPLLQ